MTAGNIGFIQDVFWIAEFLFVVGDWVVAGSWVFFCRQDVILHMGRRWAVGSVGKDAAPHTWSSGSNPIQTQPVGFVLDRWVCRSC